MNTNPPPGFSPAPEISPASPTLQPVLAPTPQGTTVEQFTQKFEKHLGDEAHQLPTTVLGRALGEINRQIAEFPDHNPDWHNDNKDLVGTAYERWWIDLSEETKSRWNSMTAGDKSAALSSARDNAEKGLASINTLYAAGVDYAAAHNLLTGDTDNKMSDLLKRSAEEGSVAFSEGQTAEALQTRDKNKAWREKIKPFLIAGVNKSSLPEGSRSALLKEIEANHDRYGVKEDPYLHAAMKLSEFFQSNQITDPDQQVALTLGYCAGMRTTTMVRDTLFQRILVGGDPNSQDALGLNSSQDGYLISRLLADILPSNNTYIINEQFVKSDSPRSYKIVQSDKARPLGLGYSLPRELIARDVRHRTQNRRGSIRPDSLEDVVKKVFDSEGVDVRKQAQEMLGMVDRQNEDAFLIGNGDITIPDQSKWGLHPIQAPIYAQLAST